MQVRCLPWLLVKFGPFYLCFCISISLAILWCSFCSQASLNWAGACTQARDIPPQQLSVKGRAGSYQNRQEGNHPSQEARWWGITSGGDEGPPLSPRGMPANGNHISALLSSISVTYINTQTGWKTTAILEWTFGAMQTITTITFLGGRKWWKCLIIYVRFPFCFVFS